MFRPAIRILDHAALEAADADLSAEDAARLARLRNTEKQSDLQRSLTAVRRELSGWLGRAPGDCVISHDADGAPFLPQRPDLRISISRTKGWTALAVSEHRAIGIDLELVRPIEWQPMLNMICSKDEEQLMLSLGNSALSTFYRLWTAKEAIMKATGKGFRLDARTLCLPTDFIMGQVSSILVSTANGSFDLRNTQRCGLMVSYATARTTPYRPTPG